MCLEHLVAELAGTDADRLFDREDEDLAVAHRSGARVAQDGVDDEPLRIVVDDDLDLQLRPQVDGDLRAAIVLGDPLLPAGALDLRDGQARKARVEEVLPDRLERLVADISDYLLYSRAPSALDDMADIAAAPAGAAVVPPSVRSATGPVDPAPISGAGMNCSG